MLSGSPCEGNTACEGQIPGCLQNLTACAQSNFGYDVIQGGLLGDPFLTQKIPVVVAGYGYIPATSPVLTYATLDGTANSHGVATGFSIGYSGFGFSQVGVGFDLALIPASSSSPIPAPAVPSRQAPSSEQLQQQINQLKAQVDALQIQVQRPSYCKKLGWATVALLGVAGGIELYGAAPTGEVTPPAILAHIAAGSTLLADVGLGGWYMASCQ